MGGGEEQELSWRTGEGGLYGARGRSGGLRKGWQGLGACVATECPPDLTFSPSSSSSIYPPIQGL